MRYRILGKTGVYVSEICLGTMTFGGKGFWSVMGALGASEVEGLIGAALDAGVNFIDTADVYSEGESESSSALRFARWRGRANSSSSRPKCAAASDLGANQVGLSRAHILSSIDGSLARLGLDHVDLYQIHGYDR